ncbi:hypothetical protein D9T17_17145 [Lysobacter enzymogenes]|uniref:Uncharacterized protein n=1 Tax=Lysobacter enzymogenes TaxID=69 RepID=A0A3N2RE36_LYSEN|nr:hypothetical protein D9T17_17145 [Lysobacter enzymogenes]
MALKSLDARLRGDDDLAESRRKLSVVVTHLSLPTCRRSREGGNPGFHRGMALKSLDPRLRGDGDLAESRRKRLSSLSTYRYPPAVVPAKAGTQGFIAAWR